MVEPQLLELADRFLSLTLLIYAVYKMSSALSARTDQYIAHLREQVDHERRLHNDFHKNTRDSDDIP